MSQKKDEGLKSGIGQLGLTPEVRSYIIENLPEGTLVARVIREHRERYASLTVKTNMMQRSPET